MPITDRTLNLMAQHFAKNPATAYTWMAPLGLEHGGGFLVSFSGDTVADHFDRRQFAAWLIAGLWGFRGSGCSHNAGF